MGRWGEGRNRRSCITKITTANEPPKIRFSFAVCVRVLHCVGSTGRSTGQKCLSLIDFFHFRLSSFPHTGASLGAFRSNDCTTQASRCTIFRFRIVREVEKYYIRSHYVENGITKNKAANAMRAATIGLGVGHVY